MGSTTGFHADDRGKEDAENEEIAISADKRGRVVGQVERRAARPVNSAQAEDNDRIEGRRNGSAPPPDGGNDGAATWKNMGLVQAGRIGRISVHPTDANTGFACVGGRLTGPQEERGVFRTKDGGATWQRVLFVNPNAGCSGLSLDPKNPDFM